VKRQENTAIVEQDKYSVVAQAEQEDAEQQENGGEKVKLEHNRNEVEYSYDEAPQQDQGASRVGKNLWDNKVGADIRFNKKTQPKIASVGAAMKSYEEMAEEQRLRQQQQQQTQQKQQQQQQQQMFVAKPVQPSNNFQTSYSANPDLLFDPLKQMTKTGPKKYTSGDLEDDDNNDSSVKIDISKFMNK